MGSKSNAGVHGAEGGGAGVSDNQASHGGVRCFFKLREAGVDTYVFFFFFPAYWFCSSGPCSCAYDCCSSCSCRFYGCHFIVRVIAFVVPCRFFVCFFSSLSFLLALSLSYYCCSRFYWRYLIPGTSFVPFCSLSFLFVVLSGAFFPPSLLFLLLLLVLFHLVFVLGVHLVFLFLFLFSLFFFFSFCVLRRDVQERVRWRRPRPALRREASPGRQQGRQQQG